MYDKTGVSLEEFHQKGQYLAFNYLLNYFINCH